MEKRVILIDDTSRVRAMLFNVAEMVFQARQVNVSINKNWQLYQLITSEVSDELIDILADKDFSFKDEKDWLIQNYHLSLVKLSIDELL